VIKVLIVEDDPMVVKFNKHYLELVDGFQLNAVARSADEALEILKKERIDLVLLDIYMPGMDGLELLSKLRKMGEFVSVIVVSAARDSSSIKKALQYGAVDYLIKPFEFDRFKAALEAYLQREKLMKSHEDFSQEELDRHLLAREREVLGNKIPKGLDKNTLKLVWDKIVSSKGVLFSTEEISQQVGISRISMRKYVLFLEEAGILKKEVVYGSPGRPVNKYKCLSSDYNLINSIFNS
jgi:two-component system, CitB family, response regulator MalR